MSISMLRNEMAVRKPVRLLGVSLPSLRATIRSNRNSASRFRAIRMISVSRAGSMRSPAVVIGRFAFKFARNAQERASNLCEAKLYRNANGTRRALVCSVLWVSRNGLMQIAASWGTEWSTHGTRRDHDLAMPRSTVRAIPRLINPPHRNGPRAEVWSDSLS